MSKKYIELTFDIEHHVGQRAEVKHDILVSELIDEIFAEFEELNGKDRYSFALYPVNKKSFLNPSQSLKNIGVEHMDHLILGHRDQPPNFRKIELAETVKAELCLKQTNQVFPINWYPAIIGRFDHTADDNDSLIVDLTKMLKENETRISRRHIEISFRGDRFYLRALSKNSKTHLRGQLIPFGDEVRLKNQDEIDLAEGTATFIFCIK